MEIPETSETPTLLLRDVLPREFFQSFMEYSRGYGDSKPTPAAKLLDVPVLVVHDQTHDNETYQRWPGLATNVHCWWSLTNGMAVGWNENPGKGWSFPVVRYREPDNAKS